MLISRNKKMPCFRLFLLHGQSVWFGKIVSSLKSWPGLFFILAHFFLMKVLMRVEQDQKVTEDARIYAEQDAAAQRYAAQVLQVYNFLFYSQFIFYM